MKRSFIVLLSCFLFAAITSAADPAAPKTVIEISKPKPQSGELATIEDVPTKLEKPFRKKVTEKPLDLWAGQVTRPPAEGEKPDPAAEADRAKEIEESLKKSKAYTLAGQAGQYVGWFGIVRGMRSSDAAHRTELTVQHCYYDDSTDLHQQIVSIRGAGDFTALVTGKPDGIPALGLIRVYGKVSAAKSGGAEVAADYVRVWNWGTFAFMDYGIDKTDKKWRALRKVEDEDVYSSRPTTAYYESVIGKVEQTQTKPADKK